jgi:glycosyltransferase involved in cell wall biosynthesis
VIVRVHPSLSENSAGSRRGVGTIHGVVSVSVIIPWKDTAIGLLERAVASVAIQTWRGPTEVVICDDGSEADNSRHLRGRLEQLQDLLGDTCLSYTSTPPGHAGPSAARNHAARASKGEYLSWLDADDEILPDALASLVHTTAEDRYGLAVGQCVVRETCHEDLRRDNHRYLSLAREYQGTRWDPFSQVVFSCQPQLVHRDLFFEVGGFAENFEFAEVTEFFLRVAGRLTAHRIGAAPDAAYLYYRRDGSRSTHRAQLESFRKSALLRYAKAFALGFDDVRYVGRCEQTGAQHYFPLIDGRSRVAPYVSAYSFADETVRLR